MNIFYKFLGNDGVFIEGKVFQYDYPVSSIVDQFRLYRLDIDELCVYRELHAFCHKENCPNFYSFKSEYGVLTLTKGDVN